MDTPTLQGQKVLYFQCHPLHHHDISCRPENDIVLFSGPDKLRRQQAVFTVVHLFPYALQVFLPVKKQMPYIRVMLMTDISGEAATPGQSHDGDYCHLWY
ncbi:hypothetical protein ACI6NS_004800 [Escherichia coli]